jgi:arginine deiminase
MDAIYRNSGAFECKVIDANLTENSQIIMEGGDILIAREDILIIGNGVRTTPQGIDFMIERLRSNCPRGRYNVIVQQLPSEPESFIHLDMVFTLLDKDKCMVFKPLITQANQYQTVHIVIEDGVVTSIRPASNILSALKKLGMELKPVVCGGSDEWDQEREQWHSGANFFAFAPGKVISYARNIHTLEELSKNGFDIVEHFGVSRYDEEHLSGYGENFETIEELNEAYREWAKNCIEEFEKYEEKIRVIKESLI